MSRKQVLGNHKLEVLADVCRGFIGWGENTEIEYDDIILQVVLKNMKERTEDLVLKIG